MSGLLKIETLLELWRGDRPGSSSPWRPPGVLGSGLLRGVMIGAACRSCRCSQHLGPARRGARSHPGTRHSRSHERHPGGLTPGVLIVRQSQSFYFNVKRLRHDPRAGRAKESSPPKLGCSSSAGPRIDLRRDRARRLADQLAQRIRIQAVETRRGSRPPARHGRRRQAERHQPDRVPADVIEAFGQNDSGPPTLPRSTEEP